MNARTIVTIFSAAAVVVFGAVTAKAIPVTFSGSLDSLSASASFDKSGTNLLVTLANTSGSDVGNPSQVLTAVFFSLAGDPALTPVSAVLTPGSIVYFGTTDPDGVVGGEWAYKKGFLIDPTVGTQGNSSVGLEIFGPADLFPGTNLQGPDSPDGIQYGLTSPVDDPTIGNAAVTGQFPLIKSSVDFVLSGLPGGFDPNTDISKVYFQYGTDLTEPRFPGDRPPDHEKPPIPEPMTVLGVLSGIVGIAGYMRRRNR
jgi:hypothetical protein